MESAHEMVPFPYRDLVKDLERLTEYAKTFRIVFEREETESPDGFIRYKSTQRAKDNEHYKTRYVELDHAEKLVKRVLSDMQDLGDSFVKDVDKMYNRRKGPTTQLEEFSRALSAFREETDKPIMGIANLFQGLNEKCSEWIDCIDSSFPQLSGTGTTTDLPESTEVDGTTEGGTSEKLTEQEVFKRRLMKNPAYKEALNRQIDPPLTWKGGEDELGCWLVDNGLIVTSANRNKRWKQADGVFFDIEGNPIPIEKIRRSYKSQRSKERV